MAVDNRSAAIGALITAGRDREAAQRGAGLDVPTETIAPHHHGGSMEPLAQFALLGPALGAVIAGIGPDQLDNPTPCADFTVRGVLEHMIGGGTMFAAAYRGEEPGHPEPGDPIAAVQVVLASLGEAISAPGALDRTVQAPFGEVDGETFARFVVLDGLVHGWDIATATGQVYEPADELVAAVDGFAHQALDPLRDGQTFAEAVEPAAGASPIERLANHTGRRRLATT